MIFPPRDALKLFSLGIGHTLLKNAVEDADEAAPDLQKNIKSIA